MEEEKEIKEEVNENEGGINLLLLILILNLFLLPLVEPNTKGFIAKENKRKIDGDPKDPEYINHLLKSIDKNELDPYFTGNLCKGFLRDAHTIIECGDTFCKSGIGFYFSEKTAIACPDGKENLGGRPLDHVVPDPSIQKIVDILYPEFKKLDIIAVTEMYKAFEAEGGLPVDRDMKEEFREIDFTKFKTLPE